jgi:hypothetical protein
MRPTPLVVLALTLPSIALAQEACELQRVIGPPEIRSNRFAYQIVTNGAQWLVADDVASTACGGEPLSCGTGAVYSYEMVGGRLELRQTILPPDTALYDGVGGSIDIDGNRLIVGIGAKRWPGETIRRGAAYIYEFDGLAWVETDRIQPPTEVTSGFAFTVLLDGWSAIAKQAHVDRFYHYRFDGDSWQLRQTLTPPDMIPPSCFGCAMTSGDGWYFFGNYLDDSVSRDGGSVYVYRQQPDGTLEFTQKIAPENSGWFGSTLSYDNGTLVVGAPLAERDFRWQGVVQTYVFDGDQWTLGQEFTHRDPEEQTEFGATVVLRDDLLLVRARGENSPAFIRGMSYVYRRGVDGQWREADRLQPDPPRLAGKYGTRMATDGRQALIGAFEDQRITGGVVGAAYLFDLECGDCPPDLDADGTLTIFDFLTFLNLFQDGDAQADFDGDGELTIFDFLAFQTAFDAGCE